MKIIGLELYKKQYTPNKELYSLEEIPQKNKKFTCFVAKDKEGNIVRKFKGPRDKNEEIAQKWMNFSTVTKEFFKSPDGSIKTYDKFLEEIERGHLHGCIISC